MGLGVCGFGGLAYTYNFVILNFPFPAFVFCYIYLLCVSDCYYGKLCFIRVYYYLKVISGEKVWK